MIMPSWFNTRYGSRSGFVNSKWHQLGYFLGRYRSYQVSWDNIERLVFVCTGNICRSAFAETVAKTLGLNAISVGVHAKEGGNADPQAICMANSLGYDMTGHRTTPAMYPVYKKTDILIAMEPWQANLVKNNLALSYPTTLLGLWGNPIRPYISDPYLRSQAYFEHCFKYIEEAVNAVATKIRKTN